MSTVIFMPFHWASDINSTFALARKLRNRGHRVIYLCIPDVEQRIRAQGLDFIPIFDRVFPQGSIAEYDARQARGEDTGTRTFEARFEGMCEDLRKGEIEKSMKGIQADLFLTSSGMPWVGIAATRMGVPVISFSSTLISVFDSRVPPFRSDSMPPESLYSRIRVFVTWQALFLRRWLFPRVSISPGLKALARSCNYPVDRIDFKVETWPRLLMPELVFCPEDFDFPRTKNPDGAYFVEASIDTERSDTQFPVERLIEGRPLIYCTLGTVVTVSHPQRAGAFFQMFMDMMNQMPECQAIVVLGNHLKIDDFNPPENVLVVNEAPQIGILARASLMVSHGGIGGVKEATFMGVPMILIPLFYDQPGNAARVVYHGLGERLPLKRLNAPELSKLIHKVIEDPSYGANVKAMSKKFRAVEEQTPSIEIIEKALNHQLPDPPEKQEPQAFSDRAGQSR